MLQQLKYQIDDLEHQGYALPDLGGVVQQTVGGFTAMGCAGGSLYHDYYEAVQEIRMVNGKGEIKIFTRPRPDEDPDYDNPYWGVMCSMGLMGIITEVTFNLRLSFKVVGSQLNWPVAPVPSDKKATYPITWDMRQSQGLFVPGTCAKC